MGYSESEIKDAVEAVF
jgi:Ca2+-binding EF-hand superfamily protein